MYKNVYCIYYILWYDNSAVRHSQENWPIWPKYGQKMVRHGQIWLAYWTFLDATQWPVTPVDHLARAACGPQNMSSCSSHGPWWLGVGSHVLRWREFHVPIWIPKRILSRVDNRQILKWYWILMDIGLPTELNEFIVSLYVFLQLHKLKLLDMFSSLIYSASEWQWGINDYPEWKMKASLATSMVP